MYVIVSVWGSFKQFHLFSDFIVIYVVNWHHKENLFMTS